MRPARAIEIDASVLANSRLSCQRRPLILCIGGEHFAIFGMEARAMTAASFRDAVGHDHASVAAVDPSYIRGIRHFHAGQFADHRLDFEDRLQCSLCDLGW